MRALDISLPHDRLEVGQEPSAGSISTRRRVVFVDLARVIAILLMIQGHTLDALLGSEYRTTTAFYVWSFSRGLTSCLFFFLAGFAFVLATYRRDDRAQIPGWPLRRFGRFVVFLLIGYGLHSPAAKLDHISLVTGDKWRTFLAVDALQCLGVLSE